MNKNKVFVVSGGSGLIGSAIVLELLAQGAKIVNLDLLPFTLADFEFHGSLKDSEGSVLELEHIQRAFEVAKSTFGRIDGAIHAAYPRSDSWGTRFGHLNSEDLKTNLFGQLGGAILFSQVAVNELTLQGGGVLLHLGSIQGAHSPRFEHYLGTEMSSPIEYTAIKAGVIGITKWLAKFCFDRNIRVNSVSPGGVLNGQDAVFVENYRSSTASKGLLSPIDVAKTISFMVSDQARYINGQNVIVDDGWSL